MPATANIAYFITSHGFGHASRSAAVMAALKCIRPEFRFELFTTCPAEVFAHELPKGFGYHAVTADIGVIQASPLMEDLPATCEALDEMLPYDEKWVNKLAQRLIELKCRLVICDIAALGIAVARKADIPSLLIENFTWDWIYQGYLDKAPDLAPHIRYLADIFGKADYHVQTTPLCRRVNGSRLVGPISRRPRSQGSETRRRLGIPADAKMILVTMGGVRDDFRSLTRLPDKLPCHLVIPGYPSTNSSHAQLIPLPTHSTFYHPDLMQAADAIVGKAGYSTIAEAYRLGIPFGYVQRPLSPESAVLEKFIASQLPSRPIDTEDYQSGRWINELPQLLSLSHRRRSVEDGAADIARLISEIVD